MELTQILQSDQQFLIPYLGNFSYRKNFTGWYRRKISRNHRHEFYLIIRGSGTLTVEKVTHSVQSGDLIYIPSTPNIHYDLTPGPDLLDYYSINFPCALISHEKETWVFDENTLYHYQRRSDSQQNEWLFQDDSGPFDLPPVCHITNDKALRNLFAQLHQSNRNFGLYNRWSKEILMQQILMEIAQQNQQIRKEDMNARRIKILCTYIQQNYMNPMTLENLCNYVSLSPSYVSSIFSQYLHKSPMAYVAEKRIAAAEDLLVSSSMSIAQIATEVGFQDAFYFSKKFKQLTGLTPRQYRNQLP